MVEKHKKAYLWNCKMLVDKMLALTYALQIMESDRKHMLKYMLTSNVSRVFDEKKPCSITDIFGFRENGPKGPTATENSEISSYNIKGQLTQFSLGN